MRTNLSKMIMCLLVCACLASDLSSIESRGSAVNIEPKLDTQPTAFVSQSVIIPVETKSAIQKKSLNISFPQSSIKTDGLPIDQPATRPNSSVELKVDVVTVNQTKREIPITIFDALIKIKGEAETEAEKEGRAVFSKLIRTLSLQKLIDENVFSNISDLDDKARVVLIEKLFIALKKLQQITSTFKKKFASLRNTSKRPQLPDPVEEIIQLLNRARHILNERIQKKTAAKTAQQTQVTPAVQTAAQSIKSSTPASTASEQKKEAELNKAVTHSFSSEVFTDHKPFSELDVKPVYTSVRVPLINDIHIDIGSKLARRLKSLKSLNA